MTARHLSRRPPTQQGGFSWLRFSDDACVTSRLFLRDCEQVLHVVSVVLGTFEDRNLIAFRIKLAKRGLRNDVAKMDAALQEGSA